MSEVLTQVAEWLICPSCRQPLHLDERRLTCPEGHSFDVAKQGYVNLLGHAAPANADTVAMVDARERFLGAGHYAALAEAVADATAGAGRIVEAGAGTGHYLAACLDVSPDAVGLATDVSVAACRRAAKRHPRMASVVADTWAGLPVATASVDALVCVFAPRNATEYARVVRPGGSLVVAVPGPDHLVELRETHGLLGIAQDKASDVVARMSDFMHVERFHVRETLHLDAEAVAQVIAMGPNAFHGSPSDVTAATATLDVSVLVFKAQGARTQRKVS